MISPPLLSVCIATMNRPILLDETLGSLAKDEGMDVEWVIADGSSDGATEAVVNKWQDRRPGVRYHRRRPEGVDRDYDWCVTLSHGRYCWLMTDDDLVRPGTISAIRKAARRNFPLIVLNAEVYNADFSEMLESRRLRWKSDRVYPPSQYEQFFRDTAAYLTYIGGVVIRRDVWSGRTVEPYLGTEFIHVGVIFQNPFDEPVLVMAEPHLRIRYGNAMWSSRAFRIWMFNWPRLIWSLALFSDAAKRAVCHPRPYMRINELIKSRAKGCYSVREYRELLRPILGNPIVRFLAYAVARLPGRSLNAVCVAYVKARYPNARVLLLDLEQSPYRRRVPEASDVGDNHRHEL